MLMSRAVDTFTKIPKNLGLTSEKWKKHSIFADTIVEGAATKCNHFMYAF